MILALRVESDPSPLLPLHLQNLPLPPGPVVPMVLDQSDVGSSQAGEGGGQLFSSVQIKRVIRSFISATVIQCEAGSL